MKKIIIPSIIVLIALSYFIGYRTAYTIYYKDVTVEATGMDGVKFTAYASQEVAERIAPGQTVCISRSRKDTEEFPDWRVKDGERTQKDTIIEELISKDLWKYTLKRNVVIDKILK